jgi:hypothetical protein
MGPTGADLHHAFGQSTVYQYYTARYCRGWARITTRAQRDRSGDRGRDGRVNYGELESCAVGREASCHHQHFLPASLGSDILQLVILNITWRLVRYRG